MHIVKSCPQILEVTMEYLGDIRVLVDLCLKVLFLYELNDRSKERIASSYFTTDS